MASYAKKEQRVAVFVDIQNMYYSARKQNSRVDFWKVLEMIVGDRQLIRSIAYVINSWNAKERWFFQALDSIWFELKEKDLKVFDDWNKKWDWDLWIAMDMIRIAPKMDSIILLTWDSDFIPVIEYIKNNAGCLTEVVAFSSTWSIDLARSADYYADLDQMDILVPINTK